MSFNELNSVEHFIIRQLSGVNLNAGDIVSDGYSRDGARHVSTGNRYANQPFITPQNIIGCFL